MFRGILITKGDAGYKAELQNIEDSVLPDGDVRVQVEGWTGYHRPIARGATISHDSGHRFRRYCQ